MKYVVEGLIVGAFRDNLQLEILDGGLVSSHDLGVFGGRQEVFDLLRVAKTALVQLLREVVGHRIELVLLGVGQALSRTRLGLRWFKLISDREDYLGEVLAAGKERPVDGVDLGEPDDVGELMEELVEPL